ncbi:reverse transcriptase domain-containing protein [Mycolicibacterium sphagni]|uniref:Reverse transcriptase domain-containing protein n=1 Tax=Mycolicibacterium sphagni TaxID=1786 RepID=A0ABX2K1A5_9MYCO|nr:reverse transcriptase domain-containing protein [Mycolicibacterium sphagni]NTY61844.1 hypothetical protein [Mycolicibacterium sphagni]
MADPVDIERQLGTAKTYEQTILRIFTKKRQRGLAFNDVTDSGVTYFDTAANRQSLARAIAHSVADGQYQPQPVNLWVLDCNGKQRAAHMPAFVDHVVGSALFQLISHNACCYGLPGVYSYLPGTTNVAAMRALAAFVRSHRARVGPKGPPLYVLQSDFEHYGDNLPVGPDAALWPILREVVSLGSPKGAVSQNIWDLITTLTRPVVCAEDGALFTRVRGVAMGTPLVPILANLAVVPMDKAILSIDGIFYARYNDDFLIAHPDLDALHEADARIDALLDELGVKRKLQKEKRTALSATGRPATDDPAYGGRGRIDSLGLSVSYAGTMTVSPLRLRRFLGRVVGRINGAASALGPLPVHERARQLVAATNVMLDVANPFAVPGLASLLDSTTDRGALKDMDFRIARKIVQTATGRPGVRGFQVLPPVVLRKELGLVSLVHMRNQH